MRLRTWFDLLGLTFAFSLVLGPLFADEYVNVRSFVDLKQLAKQNAQQSYQPQPPLEEPLASWKYDDYLKVSFRADRATWFNQGLPFWLESFHRGFVQVDRVGIYTLTPVPGGAPVCERISFSKQDFEYHDSLDTDSIPAAGHAGLKIVGRFPDQQDAQEVLSFLGSSYFRARSGNTIYGASARGLAIDVAMTKDEEFPDFRAFWVQMPARDSSELTILAYLDSPSVCGAYQFQLTPGNQVTRIHVDAELFFRKVPEKVALTPLTSMWLWGDGLKGPPKDNRPSVHDSDGLLIHRGQDDWQWRAFARQSYPSVTNYVVDELIGFGLIQRNRAFYHYDDHNARYDQRPSVWIEPDSPWQDGTVQLLELPGAHEGIDNLAAFWIPNQKPNLHQPLSLGYEVSFFAGDPPQHGVMARATNLKVDRPQDDRSPIGIEVRFAGSSIRGLPAEAAPVAETQTVRGKLENVVLSRTEHGDWILTADVITTGDGPVELDVRLKSANECVSERFTYLLPPEEPQFVYPAVYTRQE